VIPQIDAEIAEKGHFWMETNESSHCYGRSFEILLFFTDNRLVAILEKLTVTAIEVNRVSRYQPSHQAGYPADKTAHEKWA
jgi:hypothetical protein